MNYIILLFSSMTANVIALGTITILFESKISIVGDIFRYGKMSIKEKKHKLFKLIFDVPKSWFRHFYWLAMIFFTYAFYQCTAVYIFGYNVPEYLFGFLNVLAGEDRRAQVSATHMYVVICLMTLQVYRRFYDTHFVSVFGKNSYMNILHYIAGIVFYPGAVAALLCEAPKFATNTQFASNEINFAELTYIDYGAIILFLWAWWHQHKTSKILANLRKNKKGEVVTNDHKLPHGDWFEYLSSPHQVAEVLMYTSVSIILVYPITWFFVYAWVVINQVETMIMGHRWYESTFKNFPQTRKALIPFVY